jgi:hypothetical protein
MTKTHRKGRLAAKKIRRRARRRVSRLLCSAESESRTAIERELAALLSNDGTWV